MTKMVLNAMLKIGISGLVNAYEQKLASITAIRPAL